MNLSFKEAIRKRTTLGLIGILTILCVAGFVLFGNWLAFAMIYPFIVNKVGFLPISEHFANAIAMIVTLGYVVVISNFLISIDSQQRKKGEWLLIGFSVMHLVALGFYDQMTAFDPRTGAPNRYCARNPQDQKLECWSSEITAPWGGKTTPMTTDMWLEWKGQQDSGQYDDEVKFENVVQFFDPVTGATLYNYVIDDQGRYHFYPGNRNFSKTGKTLEPFTTDALVGYQEKIRGKALTRLAETKYCARNPATQNLVCWDQPTLAPWGQKAEKATYDQLVLLEMDRSRGVNTTEIAFNDIRFFFDPTTNKPLIWYSRDLNGYKFFVAPGFDGNGNQLKPISIQVVEDEKKQKRFIESKKIPKKLSFKVVTFTKGSKPHLLKDNRFDGLATFESPSELVLDLFSQKVISLLRLYDHHTGPLEAVVVSVATHVNSPFKRATTKSNTKSDDLVEIGLYDVSARLIRLSVRARRLAWNEDGNFPDVGKILEIEVYGY